MPNPPSPDFTDGTENLELTARIDRAMSRKPALDGLRDLEAIAKERGGAQAIVGYVSPAPGVPTAADLRREASALGVEVEKVVQPTSYVERLRSMLVAVLAEGRCSATLTARIVALMDEGRR